MPTPDDPSRSANPNAGKRASLADARRLTELVNFKPNPDDSSQITNRKDASSGAASARPISKRLQLLPAKSALSTPDDFVASGAFERRYRRAFGKKRWPKYLGAAVVFGSVLAMGANWQTLQAFLTEMIPSLATYLPANAKTENNRAAEKQPTAEASPTTETVEPLSRDANLSSDLSGASRSAESPDLRALNVSPDAGPGVLPSSGNAPKPPVQQERSPATERTEREINTATAHPSEGQKRKSSPKLDALTARAEQLLNNGKIAEARTFFRRVATEGDPRGARGMAKSYDQSVLATLPVRGLNGDAAQAKTWYQKADEMEELEASSGRDGRESTRE